MLQRLRIPLSTSSRSLQPLTSLPSLSLRSYVSNRSISTSSSRTTSTTPISHTRQFCRPHAGTSNTRRSPTAIDRDLPVIKVSFFLSLSLPLLSLSQSLLLTNISFSVVPYTSLFITLRNRRSLLGWIPRLCYKRRTSEFFGCQEFVVPIEELPCCEGILG